MSTSHAEARDADDTGLPADHPGRHRQRHQPQASQEAQFRHVVREAGVLPLLESWICDHRGVQPRLSLEGLHIAMLRAAAEQKTYKRTDVTTEVARLTDECADAVGVADRSERAISYATVARLARRLEGALVDWSRHPYYGEHEWLSESGMFWPVYWWSDEMIQASIPPYWRQQYTALAIDGTSAPVRATPTEYRTNEDLIFEHAQRRAEEYGLAEPDLTDLANPCGTKPGELGPDGRPIRSNLLTARHGHRTATPQDKRTEFFGHDLIAGIFVRDFAYQGDPEECQLGPDVPNLLSGVRLVPASSNPAPPATAVVKGAKRFAPNLIDAIADRGITNKPSFVIACHGDGINVPMDHTKTEVEHPKLKKFGRNANDYYVHVGGIFPGWAGPSVVTPPELGHIDPATGEKVTEDDVTAWYVERAKTFRCSVNKTLHDGSSQYQSPLAAGRIGTERTMHTANQSATEYPSDLVYPEKYFKVPLEETARLQRTPWHTPAGQADYGRRSLIETANSRYKADNGLDPQACRINNFVAHIIYVTLVTVVLNLEEVRRFELEHQQNHEQANKNNAVTDRDDDTHACCEPLPDEDQHDLNKPEQDGTTSAADAPHGENPAPEPEAAAVERGRTASPQPSGRSNRQRRRQRKRAAPRRKIPPQDKSPPQTSQH